jgi:hypothetical protein
MRSNKVVVEMIHGLNAEGHYAEFLNAESPIPNWTECRIFECRMGPNAEISNAEFPNTELDSMQNFRMPNET